MDVTPNAIDLEASDWVARVDGGLDAHARSELSAWLAADARHRGAYVRAQAAWLDADRLASLGAGDARFSGAESPFPIHSKPGLLRRKWLLAASVVIASLLALIGFRERLFFSGQTYVSEVGEVRNIELSDGSRLVLNTDTRATVRYGDAERDIALTRGEALFNVAHDAARPFVVHANKVLVRALGTAFTVRVDDTRTDVIVTEGVVEVARVDASGTRSVQRVTANHRVMLASAESRPDVEAVAPEVVSRQLAWRDGMAAFAGEPLSAAVAEINRHSRHQIYIDDPALAARPVIGLFHANDSEAFATAAAATFGAEVAHAGGDIHLRMGATHD